MAEERTAIVIDVPAVPADEAGPRDAESRAVAEHPEFQRMLAEGRRNRRAGKGLSADEVFGESGAQEDASGGNGEAKNGHGSHSRAVDQSTKRR